MCESQPLLSIVVPVYNVDRYLDECMESLVTQDIDSSEYEVICVNDGSTDNSGNILDKYAKRYCNVIVINKSNGGVSTARNMGIDNAQGKYIWFIDSDDFILKNSLSSML